VAQHLHVHVVDPDSTRRAAMARELYSRSIHVEIYEDLDELIRRAPAQGPVLVHADQPTRDETQMLNAIRDRAGYMPVAFYSAEPRPEEIVNAMLSGAAYYLQWPSPLGELKGAVLRVARVGAEKARVEQRKSAARQCVRALTERERQVLVGVMEGNANKEIAIELGISPRTVEIHRSNMLLRLKARSTADAVRIGLESGLLD
jgi:two-component system, LuxR family, response regulator FixJ